MRLAIIGSRTINDYTFVRETILKHFVTTDPLIHMSITHIVSGGARGADSLGAQFAGEFGIPVTEYLPDWETHGKKAGFLRNQDIVTNCDMVLAFWDGISKGTGHSLSIAKRIKKPTLIIYV
jgi:hypothetical protein